jgi:translation elongation factor EF-Tu-like GTPase
MESHVIEARIRYLTTAEGGRQTGVFSGYRGQFYYGGNDYDGFQSFPDVECVVLGTEVRAFVEFSKARWDEVHRHSIYVGMPFEIHEGAKVVGKGIITRLNVSHVELSNSPVR